MFLYVDTNFLANAAANSMPPDQLRFGAPAVALSVISQVAQYVRNYHSTRVYWCLDAKEGSWRAQVLPSYKAHRKEQLEKDPTRKIAHDMANHAIEDELPQLIALLGCPCFQMPWIEGDDWAAAVIALNPGKPGIILTADKDYWQLINPQVYMIDPSHSLRYQIGADGKLVRYKGDGTVELLFLSPEETLLVKAIQGDDSDNLPGLIGIGVVGATNEVKAKRVPQFLAEETGMKTKKKTSKNPCPVPQMQDARKVVADNLAMMDLFHSRIHDKVKDLAASLEKGGLRNPVTNLTRMTIWLEQKHQFAHEAAEQAARQLVTTFRDQWTS